MACKFIKGTLAFIFRMSGRLFSNVLVFELKRQSVLVETYLRLKENALAFVMKRKDVFFDSFQSIFPMVNFSECFPLKSLKYNLISFMSFSMSPVGKRYFPAVMHFFS